MLVSEPLGCDGRPEDFHFAKHYTAADLVSSPAVRRRFFNDVLRWEGRFMQTGIGIAPGGLTYDGAHIGSSANLIPRTHSSPSKEALHIALLSLAASCEGLPRTLLSLEDALEQLERKATALEAYRAAYPRESGFMPWFDAAAGGAPLEPHLAVRYNGMLAWSLYFAAHSLRDAGLGDLAERLQAHLEVMCRGAVGLAYKGGGKIAAQVTLRPREGVPLQSDKNCDDPFAGELFSLFLDLLADWGDHPNSERDKIWADPERKRWITTAVLDLAATGGLDDGPPLETMFHGTFSVHEEWKYLLLPYQMMPVCRRLLHAAENVRCRFSKAHGLPGLLGDCHVPAGKDGSAGELTQHVTNFGIPGVSALPQEEARLDAVAASGAFGLLLAEPAAGAAWLHTTLSANADMQTAWGMAESCSRDGAVCCPLLTWDAKATTALALLGGLGSRMRSFLERDGLLPRFKEIVEGLYADFVSRPLIGELADLSLPMGVNVASDGMASVDLELVKACRGMDLPGADAWRLFRVRQWFHDHESESIDAAYCTPEGFEDWCTGGGHFDAQGADQDSLHLHIVEMFELGIPAVLLVRQPPVYPIFFDLDIYGGSDHTDDDDRVHQILWENDERILVRSIVLAILKLYPQLSSGLDLAVFGASGFCQSFSRYKASYHLVFPQILVDRPVKPWPEGPEGDASGVLGRHMVVRDHVVCCLTDESAEGGCLADLHRELLECCDLVVAPEDELEEDEGDCGETHINDWTEILDDKPLRHEPWPEAATGFRLPFTDKAVDGSLEGRPKLPLGRWRLRCEGEIPQDARRLVMEPLADLEPVEWVRLGDPAACSATALTPWDLSLLHAGAGDASALRADG